MLQRKPLLGDLPDWTRFPKPVLLLPFNEGAGSRVNDLSGNRNAGTLIADARFVPTKFGSGIYLDGTGDYINLGDLSSAFNAETTKTRGLTFVMWFYITNDIRDGRFWRLVGGMGGTGHGGWSAGGLRCQTAAPRNALHMDIHDGAFQTAAMGGGTHVEAFQWHLVVGVVNVFTSNLEIWLDGVLMDTTAITLSGITYNPTYSYIGRYGNVADPQYTEGNIDHVAIYNRTLVASEHIQLLQKPFPWFVEDDVSHLYLPGVPPTVKPWWYYKQMASIIRRAG